MAQWETILLWGLAWLGAGCAWLEPSGIAHRTGRAGWRLADPEEPMKMRVGVRAPSCDRLVPSGTARGGRVFVLVHGIGGEGPEWDRTSELLRSTGSTVYEFRWLPFESRDALVHELSAGVTRLLQCLEPKPASLVVLGHSAGGVLAAEAAGYIAVPRSAKSTRIWVITVASPLAGILPRPPNDDGSSQRGFVLDLGTRLEGYPEPAVGVRVAHVHTQASADRVMRPRRGHKPNDEDATVPGALQLTLGPHIGHDQALREVGLFIASGAWEGWSRREAHLERKLPDGAARL